MTRTWPRSSLSASCSWGRLHCRKSPDVTCSASRSTGLLLLRGHRDAALLQGRGLVVALQPQPSADPGEGGHAGIGDWVGPAQVENLFLVEILVQVAVQEHDDVVAEDEHMLVRGSQRETVVEAAQP